ncbi:hypothetical protein EMA8858_04088 [Emticicia aquatica]|uniref:Uncharacterized protein n=1 Tax=Emticicia aquatica TaxID=1681835 RepID=A0ABN8F3X6_9BACT|nr:hypothetical protein [Emticicia aquatica]CAH0997953.1 hypothetical protein EMA8858_04088 [Emticicia aquatica]
MKKVIFTAILFSSFFITFAQVRVGTNVNHGSQPIWGPEGYDHVEYYYMPDIDVFYNVPNRQYIYLNRGHWVFTRDLPSQYRNFDLYSGHKVVVNTYKPYRNAQSYRTKYASYKGRSDQKSIRNSQDSRYFENKDHPEHGKWQNDRKERNNNKKTNKKQGKRNRVRKS